MMILFAAIYFQRQKH